MMRGKFLFAALLFVATCASAKRVALVVDGNVDKDAVLHGCTQHLFTQHDMHVTLFHGREWVLTWTPVTQHSLIELAIRKLETVRGGDWFDGLEAVRRHAPDAESVFFITSRAPTNQARNKEASQYLVNVLHARVYPVGLGGHVSGDALKVIAGPCSAAFGCIANWNYYSDVRDFGRVVHLATGDPRMPPAIATTTTTVAATTTPAPVVVSEFSVYGHVYLREQGSAKRKGYAGVGVELVDAAGKRHLATSDAAGTIRFEAVTPGTATLDVNVPPGMELVPEHKRRMAERLVIRDETQNRLPPIELRFDERHTTMVANVEEAVKTAQPLSGVDIAAIVIASLLGLVFLVALLWWCFRESKEAYVIHSSAGPLYPSLHQVQPAPLPVHHGLRKKTY